MATNQSGHLNTSQWELSLYELHRKPHEVVTDQTVIGVSPRALHSELMCPICLDLMKNTHTTKECLHRFCQECIITALRSGNKECPTCRKKLVSKRSLRPDPNFDALISKIYPNRDEVQQQEKQKSFRTPTQTTLRRKRRGENLSSTPDVSPSVSRESTPVAKRSRVDPEISSEESRSPKEDEQEKDSVELQLHPHPTDEEVATHLIRNLSTTPNATIAHLANFLSIQSSSNKQEGDDGSSNFAIFAQLKSDIEDYVVLTPTTSLRQICDKYWTPGDKLKLFFSTQNLLSLAQEKH